MGIELELAEHSRLSRRLGKVSVELPVVPKDQAVDVVVDVGWGESVQTGIESPQAWGWQTTNVAPAAFGGEPSNGGNSDGTNKYQQLE